MKHPRPISTAGMLLLAVSSLGCVAEPVDPGAEDAPSTTRPPRPDSYAACPPSGIEPPAPMVLVDRSLPNLGDGVLGRLEVYEAGLTGLQVAVGFDILDEYEDLDFVSEPVDLDGREVVLWTSEALAGGRLVAMTWEQTADRSPCSGRTIVGSNVPVEELMALARASLASTTSED